MNTKNRKTKTPDIVSELREVVATPTTKGGIVKLALFVVGVLLCAFALSFVLLYFFPREKLEAFSQYGYLGVFVVTLLSSFSIVLPLPGTIVVLGAAAIWNTALVALIASIGGTLGELTAYFVGYAGRAVIAPKDSQRYQAVEWWMKRHGGWAIFLFAFFPFLIFDFVGLAAGMLKYPVQKLLIYCWLGRLPRSFIECYVGATLLELVLARLPEWVNFAR